MSYNPVNSSKLEVSDELVEAVVEKLLSTKGDQVLSDNMFGIVTNYLRGYLEKVMDNPESILKNRVSKEDVGVMIDQCIIGKFNITTRLDNLDKIVNSIVSSLSGLNYHTPSNYEIPSGNLVNVREVLDRLEHEIDKLRIILNVNGIHE